MTQAPNYAIIISESEVRTMTNKKLINTWEEFLKIECGCYTDEYGNRPCDNGALCDRCSDEQFYEKFREKIEIGA